MAVLTTKKRDRLPDSAFALPKERKYPIYDKSHAVNAKARADQMEEKGIISKSTKLKIDRAANKVIKKADAGKNTHKKTNGDRTMYDYEMEAKKDRRKPKGKTPAARKADTDKYMWEMKFLDEKKKHAETRKKLRDEKKENGKPKGKTAAQRRKDTDEYMYAMDKPARGRRKKTVSATVSRKR